jgi:hypothetical protein
MRYAGSERIEWRPSAEESVMSTKQWTVVAMLGLIAASAAYAQNSAPKKVFTNRLSFSLPVRIDERDKAELKELKFYVKAINAGKPGDWQCVETAPPTKVRFQYTAPQDGEFWFAFATVDRFGHVTPADLDREPAGLVVIVDTKAPEVEVQKLVVASGETYLQCQIRDANPDYSKIKLEAIMPDKTVRALEPLEEAPGLFRVSDANILHSVVRATTLDKAGNRAVREVNLNPAAAPAAPAVATAAGNIPSVLPAVTTASVQTTAPVQAVRTSERFEQAVAAAPVLAPPGRQLVNSTHCSLDYALDSTNAARVEGYATRDGGRSWMRLGEDADRRSPFEFDLPEDGVYGISLVVSTQTRPGVLPVAGDTPDCWIEVDATKPMINVSEVRPGIGDDAGQLYVVWSASDKNLAPEPVEILIAADLQGPWLPLARGQKPDGAGKFVLPRDIGWKVFLRVEARDLAGNCGRWETREPITLDGGKVKARVLGVNAGAKK